MLWKLLAIVQGLFSNYLTNRGIRFERRCRPVSFAGTVVYFRWIFLGGIFCIPVKIAIYQIMTNLSIILRSLGLNLVKYGVSTQPLNIAIPASGADINKLMNRAETLWHINGLISVLCNSPLSTVNCRKLWPSTTYFSGSSWFRGKSKNIYLLDRALHRYNDIVNDFLSWVRNSVG
jgi:hypothetical protein